MVIGSDYTCSCKSNYHTVTTKTVPFLLGIVINLRSSSRTLTFQSSSQKRLGQLKSCYAVAFFTKILTIKNCRKCKTKIKKSFTKILTIILSVKLPCPKCKILIVREILVLSFIVNENKRAIHRWRIFSHCMTNLITHIDKCLLKWIWFNTNRRYKRHCCLLLFGMTNNSL